MSSQDNLEKRFYEGLSLAAAGEVDRAIAVFQECVIADPGDPDFANELLAQVRRRGAVEAPDADQNHQSALEQAEAEKRWADVIRLGVQGLAISGVAPRTLARLAVACSSLGYHSSEACYLTAALVENPNDNKTNRRAAHCFARLHRCDEALACWREIETHEPTNDDAPTAIARLTIAKSRAANGLERRDDNGREKSKVESRKSKVEKSRLPASSFILHPSSLPGAASPGAAHLTPIQQLEAEIRHRPAVAEPYLRLAQLYLDKDRDFDAERLLVKAREATEEDARVRQMWEEVAMLRQSKRVAIARDEAQRDVNPSTRAAVTQAERECNRLEREVFSTRIKREPNVAVHHYELGLRLQRAEKIREARDQFQAALGDPSYRFPAALELGRCDELFGELPEALKHYRLAAESARLDQIEQKKSALYAAAKLALRIKLAKLAERYLARLLRIDPNHREAILLMQCT